MQEGVGRGESEEGKGELGAIAISLERAGMKTENSNNVSVGGLSRDVLGFCRLHALDITKRRCEAVFNGE